jgi:hypothetical protein
MFALGGISGFGYKSRSFLILAPIMAFLLALGLTQIKNSRFKVLVIIITLIWISSGIYDLIRREGTAKAGINDHPEEVLYFIADKQAGAKSIIFTADPGVTYLMNRDQGKYGWFVCSTRYDYIHKFPPGSLPPTVEPGMVFVIDSYVGSNISVGEKWKNALEKAEKSIREPSVIFLSPDKDAKLKKIIPGVKHITRRLPKYRFSVYYGQANDNVDWSEIAQAFADVRSEAKFNIFAPTGKD